MNCWLCGRFMCKYQSANYANCSHFTCNSCDVQSSLPYTWRRPFKSGWTYIADQVNHLFWDGKGGGQDHYTSIRTIDHSKMDVSCP